MPWTLFKGNIFYTIIPNTYLENNVNILYDFYEK